MKLVQKLFARLPGKFMPLERQLLAAIVSTLDAEARQLFQRQIDAVNKV